LIFVHVKLIVFIFKKKYFELGKRLLGMMGPAKKVRGKKSTEIDK
jgi:hypothetical protein